MSENVLAIDIGGSKIITAIVDGTGCLVDSVKVVLPKTYDEKLLTEIILKSIGPLKKHKPVAVGVAIPGLANAEKGTWEYAPFSGVSDFPIVDIITKSTGLKCFIENDVNVCAIGEKFYGCCKDESDYVWVTVSNGVGGALYLSNDLYVGQGFNAGEIGHFYINSNSYVCGCGRRGCLETFSSGQGISREYYKRTGINLSAGEIADLVRNGDKTAELVFKRAGNALGKALSYVVNLLNVNKIILGGGVMESFDLIKPTLMQTLEKYTFVQANKNVMVEKTKLGYHAAVIGAAALVKKNLNGECKDYGTNKAN